MKTILKNSKSPIDENTKEVVKKSKSTIIVKIIGLIAGFLVSVFLGRTLGVEGLGVLNLSLKIIATVMVLSLLGLNTVVLKNVSISFENKQFDNVANHLFSALFIVIPFTILLSIGILLSSNWLSFSIFKTEKLYYPLVISSGALIFQVLARIYSAGINGFRKIWQSNLTNETLSFCVILCGLIVFHYGGIPINLINVSLLFAFSRFCVFLTVFIYWNQIFIFRGKRKFVGREMLIVGLPLLLVSASSLISNNTDSIMLGWLSSANEVGIYVVASKLGLMTSFFHIITVSTLSPKIASLFGLGELKKMEIMVQKVTLFLLLIAILSTIFFAIFGKSILSFWGDEFVQAYIPLLIISIGQLFNIGTGATGIILMMTGFEKIIGKITLSFALFNILLNFILVPKFGAIGAAIATSISLIFENILKYHFVRSKLSISTIKGI